MVEMKKLGMIFIFCLVMLGSFGFLFVSALEAGSSNSSGFFDLFTNSGISERWELWKLGSDKLNQDQMGLLAETVKYLVLILVSLAVYGAFTAMEFPKSSMIRMILSFIVGLLGTFMITTKELLTVLISYSALTTTVLIAVPLIALLGFTVVAAYKANRAGLYASKILWAVFAILLIFKAFVFMLMAHYFVVTGSGTAEQPFLAVPQDGITKIDVWANVFLPMKRDAVGKAITDDERIGQIMGNADISTAWALLLAGVAILLFVVINGKWIYNWLEDEARRAKIDEARDTIQKSVEKNKLDAKALDDLASPTR